MPIDQYAVVGHPVAHSLSPQIHQQFAAQTKQTLDYGKIEAPVDGFVAVVDQFRADGGCGLNVTVPFKAQAWRYVDRLDELATSAQAVNTLSFRDGDCLGFNTDGLGLLADLKVRHQQTIGGSKVLILGAGGATQGVLGPLLSEQPASVSIVNRTVSKAADLVAAWRRNFAGKCVLKALAYADVDEKADIVINATSMGLANQTVPLDPVWIEGAFCYDMSYGANAKFMSWARQRGAKAAVDGLGMLVEQAAAAFNIWRGIMPQTDDVYARLSQQFHQ